MPRLIQNRNSLENIWNCYDFFWVYVGFQPCDHSSFKPSWSLRSKHVRTVCRNNSPLPSCYIVLVSDSLLGWIAVSSPTMCYPQQQTAMIRHLFYKHGNARYDSLYCMCSFPQARETHHGLDFQMLWSRYGSNILMIPGMVIVIPKRSIGESSPFFRGMSFSASSLGRTFLSCLRYLCEMRPLERPLVGAFESVGSGGNMW